MIKIYTDGSSRKDNIGGYGVVVLINDVIDYAISEQFEDVTNNQMELQAIIHAIETINEKYPEEDCVIYSDSAYCVNMCNDWIYNWAVNNWKGSKNEEVKNIDLVKKLYKLLNVDFPNFRIEKCYGHIGNIGNELADAAATNNQAKFIKLKCENGYKFKYEII